MMKAKRPIHSAKIIIRSKGTNTCWFYAKALTNKSPATPIARPAAKAPPPQTEPAKNKLKPFYNGKSVDVLAPEEIWIDIIRP